MPFNASIGTGLVNAAQKPPPGVSQGVQGQAPPQQNAVPKQPSPNQAGLNQQNVGQGGVGMGLGRAPIQALGKAPQQPPPSFGQIIGGVAGQAGLGGGAAPPQQSAAPPPQGGGLAGMAGLAGAVGGRLQGAGAPAPRQWNFGGAVRGGVAGQGNAYAPQSMRSPAQPGYLPGPQAPQGYAQRALPGPQQGYGGSFLPGPQTALPGPQTGSTALPGPQQGYDQGMGGAQVPLASQQMRYWR